MTRRWKAAVAFAVSAALLWWALRDVSPAAVWHEIRGSNLGLLALAALVQTGGFLIRAARWGVILRPAHAASRYHPRFAATCIGFMANNLLPVRVGEFARALALTRLERVSLSASLGSLVVERFLDTVVLALFVALPLFWPGFAGGEVLRRTVGAQLRALAPILLVGVAGLAFLLWRPVLAARVARAVGGAVLSRSLGDRLGGAVESFVRGLGALRHPHLLGVSFAWSLVHWLWGGLAFFIAMAAFNIWAPGFAGALFVQGVVAFVVALPSAPGFFGPFEAGARLALSPFGIAPDTQVAYAIGFHITSFFPVTLIGLWYVWRLGFSWREVERSEELVAEARQEASRG